MAQSGISQNITALKSLLAQLTVINNDQKSNIYPFKPLKTN